MVASKEYSNLVTADQLRVQKQNRTAFPYFNEGDLKFDPTYKYDNGSKTYDSSEKARAPAWTDRILFKGADINLLEYGRGEQMMSDHRPGKSY